MITFLVILVSAAVGGVLTYFYWAAFHKAEIDGKDVLLDEAKQAREWAEHRASELQAALLGKPKLPTPPAIPDPQPPK